MNNFSNKKCSQLFYIDKRQNTLQLYISIQFYKFLENFSDFLYELEYLLEILRKSFSEFVIYNMNSPTNSKMRLNDVLITS